LPQHPSIVGERFGSKPPRAILDDFGIRIRDADDVDVQVVQQREIGSVIGGVPMADADNGDAPVGAHCVAPRLFATEWRPAGSALTRVRFGSLVRRVVGFEL